MLLPVDREWLDLLRADPWPYKGIPTYTLSDDRLAVALVGQYMLLSLHRAIAQSLAAEQARRLAAMQAAEKNVEEQIARLQRTYRQLRQAAITSEILEVTAGFDALEDEEGLYPGRGR
jgi:F-type H+-transporting ATPase subunit gamma